MSARSCRSIVLGTLVLVTFAVGLGGLTGSSSKSAAASPPDAMLAFTSFRGGVAHIFAISADGSGLKRLTQTPRAAFEGSPAFSPDGTRVVYVCGNFELCIMNADGGGSARLTTNDWPKEFRYDRSPAWSPDGTRIAFAQTRSGSDGVWIVNADGSGLRQLPVPKGFNGNPSFSPDGTTIAFDHTEDLGDGWAGESDIHTIGVDGSGPRILTDRDTGGTDPAWSPDGRSIAFTSDSEDFGDIAVMNADGSGQRRVTSGATEERDPAWSPDGSRIAFSSTRGRTHGLYEVASTGGAQRRLTSGRGPDLDPAWQPSGPATAASPLAPPTAPPSIATAEAQLVASLGEAAVKMGMSLAGNPVQGGAKRLATAAGHTRAIARRIASAARPLRPMTARGRRLRRLVLENMRAIEGVSHELRAASNSLRRHNRRGANAHARSALNRFLGVSLALAKAGQIAELPQGAL